MNKKKLLVYAHYFYPDVASTGQILMELVDGLKESFDITVVCVVPSYTGKIEDKYKAKRIYNETLNGINIVRVRVPEFKKSNKISRIKNILAYFFNSILVTLKLPKQDYIFSISQPPILGGVLGVIGRVLKGKKFIYNIQDFNPEQIMAVGYSKGKAIINICMLIDKFSCKVSDKVIVVGRDMQDKLKERFNNKKVPNNVFINNWINEKEIYPLDSNNSNVVEFKEKYDLKEKYIIMYSGNIGLYYDLENLIKVIGRFNNREDIVFAFIGDGTVKDKLLSYASSNNLKNVKFIEYQDKSNLIYSLNAADIHWVINAKGIKGVSVPSKLYGVMAVGKPVLGVLERDSEARIIIEDSKCGICSEPGEYENIYKSIEYVINNRNQLKLMGEYGREYLEDKLTKDISIEKYKENILQV